MSEARDRSRTKTARSSARSRQALQNGSEGAQEALWAEEEPAAGANGQKRSQGNAQPAGRRRSHQPATPPAVTERPAMVRTTVDLAPAMHRELRDLLSQIADELGRARLTASDAHRVLVRRLLHDPETRRQFLDDCRDQLP